MWENYKRCNTCVIGIPEGEEEEKGSEVVFEAIMTNDFPQIVTHQTIDPGSSENTRQGKHRTNQKTPQQLHLCKLIYFNKNLTRVFHGTRQAVYEVSREK